MGSFSYLTYPQMCLHEDGQFDSHRILKIHILHLFILESYFDDFGLKNTSLF